MEAKIFKEVLRAEENERQRIASELHDGLGPLLSTIKLYVGEIESDDLEKEERKLMVDQANELIDEAISNTRSISNNLTPAVIMDFGLVKQ